MNKTFLIGVVQGWQKSINLIKGTESLPKNCVLVRIVLRENIKQ